MPGIAERRAEFRRLHQSGCFVIPNPWDVGCARYLQRLGFKALASTSAGAAWVAAMPTATCRATWCWRISPRSSRRPTCR